MKKLGLLSMLGLIVLIGLVSFLMANPRPQPVPEPEPTPEPTPAPEPDMFLTDARLYLASRYMSSRYVFVVEVTVHNPRSYQIDIVHMKLDVEGTHIDEWGDIFSGHYLDVLGYVAPSSTKVVGAKLIYSDYFGEWKFWDTNTETTFMTVFYRLHDPPSNDPMYVEAHTIPVVVSVPDYPR